MFWVWTVGVAKVVVVRFDGVDDTRDRRRDGTATPGVMKA
jgi:hypothetical protein